ncbi:MAG: DUF885 domain-containing protein [Acidobacteria bacterium]|nr:MAG: DUF885 domain-containing protein [Acidobacteriota bacterium]
MKTKLAALLVTVLLFCSFAQADSLDDLARDFWMWRALEQPVSSDDIPRIERPSGWVPDWSPEAVARYHKQLDEFDSRWQKMDASTWPIARQVDHRLIGSAISRVRWELDRVRNWQRDPSFYVQQSVGAYLQLLLPPPPFDAARSMQTVAMLASIPRTLASAKQNLIDPTAPFARIALAQLQDILPRLLKSIAGLKPLLDPESSRNLESVGEEAAAALESYRDWLNQRLPTLRMETAIGRDNYVFFLKNVALLPFSPEELLEMGKQEWARSVASQVYEEHRNRGIPQLRFFKDEAEQIAHEGDDELAVRRYLQTKDLVTVPDWVQHYRFAAIPPYLAGFANVTELDDFTGPSRLKENCTRYIPAPGPNLGYFAATMAKDPRGILVHEGVPGHYFQLALSWANPDPIRRHYYDSSANEGIGFYAEEMLLHAGLFDDSPRTREFIWNFMRLRALRVEVDVKLALGEFSLDQAAEYLKNTVPMDSATAHEEAAMFATTPGQAISYQIGKLQIYKFLADAHRKKGAAFNLRAFHDVLWQNGNVPVALQRWEFLGLKDGMEQ